MLGGDSSPPCGGGAWSKGDKELTFTQAWRSPLCHVPTR